MKTSEEILNKWYKPLRGISEIAFIQITEAMKEYAKEVAREALKNASENFLGQSDFAKDTRNAILNEDNIPEL